MLQDPLIKWVALAAHVLQMLKVVSVRPVLPSASRCPDTCSGDLSCTVTHPSTCCHTDAGASEAMGEDAAPGRATVLLELNAAKEGEAMDADAPVEDSLEVAGASFAIQDVWFGADGCELLCVGKQGQLVILDALSAAVVHSIAGSLNCCTGVLSGCRSLSLHPKGCVLVDSDGLVCCPSLLVCACAICDAFGRFCM